MRPDEPTTTTPTPTRIDTGVYELDAPCPLCGTLIPVLIALRTVVTVPQDDVSKLAVKLRAKPVEHLCRQGTLA